MNGCSVGSNQADGDLVFGFGDARPTMIPTPTNDNQTHCCIPGTWYIQHYVVYMYISWMRISPPGTQFFPGNSLFQLFPKFSPISSHSREKGFILGRNKKVASPGSTFTTLSTSIRFVQAFGQSFSVIFTLHIIAVAVAFTTSLNYYRGQSIEIGEIFIMTFIVVDQCFQQKKTLHLSLTA